ncbi:hypothetical protein HMP0015_2408 [Acinetobacter haemolyticus ATCC 19194]|uniref:DUF559 domain-containing protein n=1 Tax=Acinetobacter haemolyticus ATCC 19194 TaxID=707232 RepID=D4XRR6_ACIHA|nr:hypothetical protein [Acinetobacter haemolyticus]EFF82126.1 hypothetical protein HMP0015_2408 [Acinetobacter haemolyticus ATCC 19194]
MDIDKYFKLTRKRAPKTKPKSRPLPKAKQNYLEAEETLFQELEENRIGYRRKFQFESTKNWRFDFYIVKLGLLIEIAGSSWAVGRGGKKVANSFCKYDQAEQSGYKIERFEPCQIESGYVIHWIKGELERLEHEAAHL